MILTIPPSPGAFEKALESAVVMEASTGKAQLAAPIAAALTGRLEAVWRKIKETLRTAFEVGREAAQILFEQTAKALDDLLNDAGDMAEQIRTEILQRLRRFVHDYFIGCIATLPDVMQIGSRRFEIGSIQCSQKMMLGGTIKSSLAEMIAVVSEGELTVDATYSPMR